MPVKIRRGLDLPLRGAPVQTIHDTEPVRSVALLGPDYIGLRPTMMVAEGDRVKRGQPLFADKKNPGVVFTAPGGGRVRAVTRGARRVLLSVVIDIDDDEPEATFDITDASALANLPREDVREQLVASGLWTALRTRPFSRVPSPQTSPRAVFVTAMDTNPLAADPSVVIAEDAKAFEWGLELLAKLGDGKAYVCTAAGAAISVPKRAPFQHAEFAGPHPAGLVGTHIHFLEPVGAGDCVWTVGYQDVIAIGRLFTTGRLHVDRVIALGGPLVRTPRLVRSRLGASLSFMVDEIEQGGEVRIVSGSVLGGRRAADWAMYLGRHHLQVTALAEPTQREMFGWIAPGFDKFSVTNVLASALFRRKQFDLNTSQNGSIRAMVPIGSYERVMPLDILPTQLLRALIVRDTDTAQALGCLELDEEDLALCSFVCPGKYDYGPALRAALDQIEKEG